MADQNHLAEDTSAGTPSQLMGQMGMRELARSLAQRAMKELAKIRGIRRLRQTKRDSGNKDQGYNIKNEAGNSKTTKGFK